MMEEEVDFERPPLTEYLRQILEKYPDGGQILKETIQNAEDARAEEICFLLDERKFGKLNLLDTPEGKKSLDSLQGPALYVYNDAEFTKDDWKGIISPTVGSLKRDNPEKVGKFGIGFSSVYHVTDCPWILSGSTLSMMDPQHIHFSKEVRRWNMMDPKNREIWASKGDQSRPWKEILNHLNLPDIFSGHSVPGTIFRFPLRAESTELSDNIYTTRKVKDNLFSSLEEDINVVLLFLKSIKKIKIECISSNGKNDVLTYIQKKSVQVQNDGMCKTTIRSLIEEKDLASFYVLKVLLEDLNQCPEYSKRFKDLELLAKKMKVIPEVSIAGYAIEEGETSIPAEYNGRVSVMLPLPSSPATVTGLPVIVNAFLLSAKTGVCSSGKPVMITVNKSSGILSCWNCLFLSAILCSCPNCLL